MSGKQPTAMSEPREPRLRRSCAKGDRCRAPCAEGNAEVVLDILPRLIEPAAWAGTYDETLRLLHASPVPLLGPTVANVVSLEGRVLSRELELDKDIPALRRWCVIDESGREMASLQRHLGAYVARSADDAEPVDDILVWAAGQPWPAHVTPTGPRDSEPPSVRAQRGGHPAVLAAAMLVEDCFPLLAMVSGAVEPDEALSAQRWAQTVLGRHIALPVRTSAFRLVERLSCYFAGVELVALTHRLLLGDGASRTSEVARVFGGSNSFARWLKGRRRPPDGPPALRIKRSDGSGSGAGVG